MEVKLPQRVRLLLQRDEKLIYTNQDSIYFKLNSLNVKAMNKGDINYFKIITSLDRLKTCPIEKTDISSAKFGMKLTKTDTSLNYGTHNYYQIELFNNGEWNDILSGQYVFSYQIKNNTTWYRSYDEWHNWFTIEYKKENDYGKILFDSDAGRYASCEEILYYIIYAFIFLSEIDDIENVKKIYSFLFQKQDPCGTLGQRIDLYKNVKDIYARIVEKYPFMNEPINKGLEERLKKIKEELLQASLIENNL